MAHIFYCAWLKTQVETCVTGTLDMSQAFLRHKWKPGFRTDNLISVNIHVHVCVYVHVLMPTKLLLAIMQG